MSSFGAVLEGLRKLVLALEGLGDLGETKVVGLWRLGMGLKHWA